MFKFRDEGSNVFRFYKTGIGGIIIGKVSVQLHTIVKQISFPQCKCIIFVIVFFGCAEILPHNFAQVTGHTTSKTNGIN